MCVCGVSVRDDASARNNDYEFIMGIFKYISFLFLSIIACVSLMKVLLELALFASSYRITGFLCLHRKFANIEKIKEVLKRTSISQYLF